MKEKFTIKSIGWALSDSAGGYPGNKITISLNNKPEKSDIFRKPFKNFGRLDDMSKSVCTSIAFALRGSKLYPRMEKQPVSIFFNNITGALNSDNIYFQDFIKYDEQAGRANLFLYTLPSSPLGEASVHFGLTGNLAYFANSINPLQAMFEAAEDACVFRKSPQSTSTDFLIGIGEFVKGKAESIFLLLSNSNSELIPELDKTVFSSSSFYDLKMVLSKIVSRKN
jgi:hypothetical protein